MINENVEESNTHENDSNLGQVLFLRHPETIFNIYRRSVPKDLIECLPQYIDCCLSNKGLKQIEEIKNKISSYRIKYVFSCPLFRCLQTCELVLKDHPDRENLTVIVDPFIISMVHSLDDFSININAKQKLFNKNSLVKFDWDYFNSLYRTDEERELFYLSFIQTENELQSFVEKIKKINYNSNDEIKSNEDKNENSFSEYELILKGLADFLACKKKGESLNHLFKRCEKFRDYLKFFIKELLCNEKILVFTHSSFTKLFTSKSAYNMKQIKEFPPDGTNISNCDILSINFKN